MSVFFKNTLGSISKKKVKIKVLYFGLTRPHHVKIKILTRKYEILTNVVFLQALLHNKVIDSDRKS